MASRVEWGVVATPIVTIAAGTDNPSVDSLNLDVGKAIGSAGTVTIPGGVAVGYASGVAAYKTSATNLTVGQTATALDTFTSIKFLYIKHTGYLYSSSSVLGAATAYKLKICMVATIADATTIAILNPGESIVLAYNNATTPTIYTAGDSVAIAVEYYGTT